MMLTQPYSFTEGGAGMFTLFKEKESITQISPKSFSVVTTTHPSCFWSLGEGGRGCNAPAEASAN